MWTCAPTNLDKGVEMGDDFLKFAAKILKDLDLKKLQDEVVNLVETM